MKNAINLSHEFFESHPELKFNPTPRPDLDTLVHQIETLNWEISSIDVSGMIWTQDPFIKNLTSKWSEAI